MSRRQWGHGYWTGRRTMIVWPPRVDATLHGWRWELRHCWWRYFFRVPFRVEVVDPSMVYLTVVGFCWVLDFTRRDDRTP